MEKQEWKYKISSGKMPVILMLVMCAIFGGLTAWLHSTNNGAYVFSGILTAVMLFVLVLTIYRLLFYKVLIGADGVYYQSSIGNGRYYNYSDIEKAWISSGTAQNGGQEQFCNIAVSGKTVIRFPFFYKDEDAVAYLIKRVKDTEQPKTTATVKREYLIDGKVYGKTKIGIGIVILIILFIINSLIIKEIGFHATLISGYVIGIVLCCMLLNDYIFFRVRICREKFYCRTSPFNGRWFRYSDITSCKEIRRVVRHYHHGRGSLNRTYYYFFEFTDNNGKKHKFQFSKAIHEHEINILKERIE